jgi:N-acetylmuramoyl-L-alanine amidase CwlA
MTYEEALQALNIRVDLIPSGNSNRPGTAITVTHITIHNTDNSNAGADALAHARYVKGADARARRVSWHFTVDDQNCVRHLPLTEMGWHAGQRGNARSVAIEICQNQGIDQNAAIDRACLLTAVLMKQLDIPANKIVSHQFWTTKNCPRVILERWNGGMARFVATSEAYFNGF